MIGKHELRFTGFDDKIIALYARGLTVRDIQAFLSEMYATDVSADLISTVTEAVTAEVTAWQGGRSSRCIRCELAPAAGGRAARHLHGGERGRRTRTAPTPIIVL